MKKINKDKLFRKSEKAKKVYFHIKKMKIYIIFLKGKNKVL